MSDEDSPPPEAYTEAAAALADDWDSGAARDRQEAKVDKAVRDMAPNDPDAERAVIGAMLVNPLMTCEIALSLLSRDDFFSPQRGIVFEAIDQLWQDGQPIDLITVMAQLDRTQPANSIHREWAPALMRSITKLPHSGRVGTYCELIIDCTARRKVIEATDELLRLAWENELPGAELLQLAKERLEAVDATTTLFLPDGLSTLDDFLDRPPEEYAPWVVPGLLRRNWRVMLVATEGAGKSVLLRQIGIAAAAGLHPLTRTPFDPVRVLIIDGENPDEAIEEVALPMKTEAERTGNWDPDRLWLWRQPQGVDLTQRRDRIELEAVIRAARPDLVCLGPIYKMYVTKSKDEEEPATRQVTSTLDVLRTRYQFGLLMEHHAPMGTSGKRRELRPHGSAFWMRWPELGISMNPKKDSDSAFRLGRFRGDRLPNQWPEELQRSGGPWLWAGIWPPGTFDPRRPEENEPMF